MSLAILGLGSALPENCVRQAHAVDWAIQAFRATPAQATGLQSLYEHSGIETRHTVFPREAVLGVYEPEGGYQSEFLPKGTSEDRGPTTAQRLARYEQEAPPLAEAASRQALEAAGISPRMISHLVTVSCTGFFAPGIDVHLIRQLSLPVTTERVHVGFMGCHGALNGLRAACGLVSAAPGTRVMLCAVELCSLHYYYGWDADKVIANALFSDGAAALIGVPANEAPAEAWRVAATGSCLLPDSLADMTWTIGDHGFEMTLSARVPLLIGDYLRPWLQHWLGRHQLRIEDIGSWALHPGGPRILDSVERAIGLSTSATAASRAVLRRCGNMSSPTVLFVLQELIRTEAPRPCVCLAFGPGLIAEAALLV